MAARTNRAKVSLEDRIDILNKNTTQAPSAKEILTIASDILALVRDKMIGEKEPVQLAEYSFNVCEKLDAAIQEKNEEDLSEPVRIALEDSKRIMRGIERTLRRGVNTPCAKCDVHKVEGHMTEIRRILATLGALDSSVDENPGMGERTSHFAPINPRSTAITCTPLSPVSTTSGSTISVDPKNGRSRQDLSTVSEVVREAESPGSDTRTADSSQPSSTQGSLGVVEENLLPVPQRLHLSMVKQFPYQSESWQKGWTALPSIYFKVKGMEGVKSTDAMGQSSGFSELDDRDDPMFTGGGVGNSVSCRIRLAGYLGYSKPGSIATTNHKKERSRITRGRLAYNVAKHIKHYLDELEDKKRIIPFRFEDIFLTRLVNVSRASWQPEICFLPSPVPQLPYTGGSIQTNWDRKSSILFSTCGYSGVKLLDAENGEFEGIDFRGDHVIGTLLGWDYLSFDEDYPPITIRIHFPGYPSSTEVEEVLRQWAEVSKLPEAKPMEIGVLYSLTKSKLAQEISKCIRRYIADLEVNSDLFPFDDKADEKWRLGQGKMRFEHMTITELNNVSLYSWSPIICVEQDPIDFTSKIRI